MRYYLVEKDGPTFVYDLILSESRPDQIKFQIEGQDLGQGLPIWVRKLAGKYFVSQDGIRWRRVVGQKFRKKITCGMRSFEVHRGFLPSRALGQNSGGLVAQMPGKVVAILVKEGERVEEGSSLLVLEAMKMENEIKAAQSGIIKSIHVKPNQVVEASEVLMEFEAEG